MDLKETISGLSDTSLIELFKSECICTYDYFVDIYDINQQTFKDCMKIGDNLPLNIRQNIEDCLINGIKRIKTYSIWDIHVEFSKNYYDINAIVFIDADNMMYCIERLNTLIEKNITNIKFVVGMRNSQYLPKSKDYTNFFRRSNCYLLRTLTRVKEATDHMLSMLISALNVSIPKYIDFVICSNDNFSLECIRIIENDCRQMKLISNLILKEDINKQINNILNKYNTLDGWVYNKNIYMYLTYDLNTKCKRLMKLKTSSFILLFTENVYSSNVYNSEYDFCIKNNLDYLEYTKFKLYGANKKYRHIKQTIIKYLLNIN